MKSQWEIFSAAPHRMMFFGGFLQIVLTMLWWSTELIGRYTSLWETWSTTVVSNWTHAFLMIYTLPTFFIFGFLMTTYPRWMNGEFIPYRRYVRAFIFLFLSLIMGYIGLMTHLMLVIMSVLFFLVGWTFALHALFFVYFKTSAPNKRYETLLNFFLLSAYIGIISYLMGLITGKWHYFNFSLHAGIWLYLIPVFVVVCHRMIPFFSECVLKNYHPNRPQWTFPVLIIGVIGHLILEMQDLLEWRLVTDIPLMLMAIDHSIRWKIKRSFEVRLLAVLHVAFLWLSIALALYNLQSFILLYTGELVLGKAPLHAITVGFMMSLIVGMASRVTLGHSGRILEANALTWFCFWGISITATLRILAEIPMMNTYLHLNIISSLTWFIFLLPWVWYYFPMVIVARVDGKLG